MQKEAGPKDADRPWRASPEPVKGRQQANRRKDGQRISHKKSERAKLVPTWCGRWDLNPHTEVLAPKTSASAIPPLPRHQP